MLYVKSAATGAVYGSCPKCAWNAGMVHTSDVFFGGVYGNLFEVCTDLGERAYFGHALQVAEVCMNTGERAYFESFGGWDL